MFVYVVTVFSLSNIEPNICAALPEAWVLTNAGTHAEPLC